MKFIDTALLTKLLRNKFDDQVVLETDTNNPQPIVTVEAARMGEIASFLSEYPSLFFDFLSAITAIDLGPEAGRIEVLYHIYSLPLEHATCIKVSLDRNNPHVPTVQDTWKTADWHEREAYDLVGVHFDNHPDLRRILLPADWQGHPLRKDYVEAEEYHGIKTN